MRPNASRFKQLCVATSVAWLCAANLSAQSFLEEAKNAVDLDGLLVLHQVYNIPRGDLDGGGDVAFADFLFLSNEYGMSDVGYENGDLNLDGVVSIADFGPLSTNFGTSGFRQDPPSRPPTGNLGLSLSDGRVIVSSENKVEIVGMEIRSPSGSIEPVPDTDSSPFTVFLANDSSRIMWGNIGTAVVFAGDLDTRARSTSDDLVIDWLESGSFDVYTRTFNEGDELTGNPAELFPHVRPPVVDPPPIENPLLDQLNSATLDQLKALQEENNLPRADFDASGRVEFADFLVLLNNYGNGVGQFSSGDVNLDNRVGLEDFAVLHNRFGMEGFVHDPPPVTPASLSLSSDDRGRVLLSAGAEDVGVAGFEVTSSRNTFLVGRNPDASPFTFYLSESDDRIAVGNLGSSVTIAAGSNLTTNIRLRPGEHNVTLSWFQEDSYEVFSNDPMSVLYEPDSNPIFAADLDFDGRIAFSDFLILSNHYGNQVAPSTNGDIDGDGEVQFPDFVFLAFHFGEGLLAEPVSSVPEPSTGLMLLIASLGVLKFRQSIRT